MNKYFGTDGIRGIANEVLTPELAFKLGRVGGAVLLKETEDNRPRVLIGKDTRISGEMLESALMAGLLSIGAEVLRLGVISTPGVAYLTKDMGADLGIMISASHNKVEDNGIKFFQSDGFKLNDETEAEIERLIDLEESDNLPRPIGEEVGFITNFFEGGQKYLSYLKSTIEDDLLDQVIVIDGAHGATYSLAPYLFGDLEADTITIGCNPDGTNINEGYGSTHPEKLQEKVVETEADFGLAFDGDGDRLIAVDDKGQVVDGDKIMFILAKDLKEQGLLHKDMVVSTVMSNLGFYKALEEYNIHSDQTKVGDRYVVEEMRAHNYNLGGEQSGHIIMLDHNTTGDGLLTGIHLAHVVKKSGKKLSELQSEMVKFPQELINVKVDDKYHVTDNETVKQMIDEVEEKLAEDGRVLVRPSGTEPLVRVMVEAETEELAADYAKQIAEVVTNEMGL